MPIGTPPPTSEITPQAHYLRRREFIRDAALFTATTTAVGGSLLWLMRGGRADPRRDAVPEGKRLPATPNARYATDEAVTPFRDATTYDNFYEFGTDKADPAENAHTLRPRPWTVSIEGEVERPRVVDVDALLASVTLEERVYRMRCVEAWSMVIPWERRISRTRRRPRRTIPRRLRGSRGRRL
jgi:sulfoxide reductase catalytic subunit YedY